MKLLKHETTDVETFETCNHWFWNMKPRLWKLLKHDITDIETFETQNYWSWNYQNTKPLMLQLTYHCLSGKLRYLQHSCVGDTIVFH